MKARREKLAALDAAGVAPFAYRLRPHARRRAAAIAALPDGAESRATTVRVAGRLVAWRAHGKTVFAHLADASGRIQLYFRKRRARRRACSRSSTCSTSATSSASRARCSARAPARSTVRVRVVSSCSRSRCGRCRSARKRSSTAQTVRHSGFADPEQRYRQRYADLAVHPEVRALFVARSRMITAIRAFLDGLRLPRGRDAGAAAAVRRRGGAAVRDAPQRARHAAVPAHRGRAVSQAARRRRVRPRVRDRPRLPERGHRPDAQSRVHDARVLRGVRRLRR